LFKPVSIGQPESMAAGRPWWQFAKTPRKGFVGAGIWIIVALLQLMSAHSSEGRVSMLIAAGGAVASLVLAVGNLGSAIVLLRRQRSHAAARTPAPPGHHGPTAGK
jgi:predicted lysophospholipase L1 biosynthesis ABC-type transport system permease subunit